MTDLTVCGTEQMLMDQSGLPFHLPFFLSLPQSPGSNLLDLSL